MKYEAISKYSSTFSVRKMCKVLELDSSNYYRWKRAEEKRKQKISDELKLVKQVEKVFNDSDKTYGYRAMQSALKNEGIVISEYKIRRIMRENMIIS
ncbi:MAG: transposase [Lachnospiraceae bacterium]|nr:transposase [Lachnospiraceae bacterium]